MNELQGWLLDVYADEQEGAVFWLAGEDGGRYRLTKSFPVTFYVGGPFERLRHLWRYLQKQTIPVGLERVQRRDLFSGPIDVLAVTASGPVQQDRLFWAVRGRFPDLD